MDRGLTPEQVAERLQISRSQVYTLIHAGKLRGRRVGLGISNIRVMESDLQAFLDDGLIQPSQGRVQPEAYKEEPRLLAADWGDIPDYF